MTAPILLAGLLLLAPSAHSASGRTGPVGLELKLLKSKLKVGERLFVKTTLLNFSKSKEEMIVIDWIYRGADNLGDAWDKQLNSEVGSTIEIQDSRGRRVNPEFFDVGIRHNDNPFEQTVKPTEGEDLKLYQGWVKSGLTPQQAADRLTKKHAWDAERRYSARHPVVRLKQGESAVSLSWCAEREPGNSPLAVTCPGGGFVELPFFPFDRPGRYRIRAVYNSAPTSKSKQWADEWSVRVETAWVAFEVRK
jgi:hypothetical protein